MSECSISIWDDVKVLKISKASGGYAGTIIIRDIDLWVGEKEIVALLGRNGTGKTTLMKYIMGLVVGEAETISLNGHKLPDSPARRARAGLGYVPQGRYIFPRLTVRENILASAVACRKDANQAVNEVFEELPLLASRPNILAGSLSGGQQQILSIGRALATNPKLLLLDEPTEGVQPSIVDEIEEMLVRLNRQRGIAVLLAEQNLDFALSLANRAYVMDKGRIAQAASREELLADKQVLHQLLGV
jgi:ABC-type branched-subunit amino acid transport system ATPase component